MAQFFKPQAKKSNLGKQLSLNIEKLDLNGSGVGRDKGKTVFVDGALPGEQVIAKVCEEKSKFIRADVVEVISASEYRVTPLCKHIRHCGGCDLQHLSETQQIIFKQNKITELFARNHINSPLPWQEAIAGNSWHYRRKARIGVQYDKLGKATVGFRKKQSNHLQNIKYCPVLAKEIADIFPRLTKIVNQLTLSKAVGHIEVIYASDITLVIRQLKPLNEKDRQLWLAVAQQNDWQLLFDSGSDVVPLTHLASLSYFIEDDISIAFASSDFIQVNHIVNLAMVQQAMQWLALNEHDVVLDLFCGLGNFSLPIAKRVKQVVGVEGVDKMVEKAQLNAKNNGLTNVQFFQANLNENWQQQPWVQRKFNKVLLDPARAGAFEAIPQLVKLAAQQVLYVSCDPATLARDAKLMLTSGYEITKIALMDMFSHTKHVETMVLFTKKSSSMQ